MKLKGENMFNTERFTAVFLMTVILGLGYFAYNAMNTRAECVQSGVSQNYTADQIRKICR